MPSDAPRPARKRYQQLTLNERGIIQRMLTKKARVRQIANLLGKSRSTIFREIRRNRNAGGLYIEAHAQASLARRRLNARAKFRKIENDVVLEKQAKGMLECRTSSGNSQRRREAAHCRDQDGH